MVFSTAALIGVANHRHHEAAVGSDRDADVVIVLVDQVGSVDLRVDGGHVLERLNDGFGEEAHETKFGAVLLLEHVLVLVPQAHHLGHVDFVERRQHGGGILGVLQPARDGLAQLRHPNALFARGVVDRRRDAHRDGSRRCSGGGRLRRSDGREHVAFQHLAAHAASGHRSGIDLVVGCDLGGRRRGRHGRRGRLGGDGGGGRGSCDRRWLRRSAPCQNLAEQSADADGFAVLGGDLGQHARRGGVDFQRHLVGFEFDERLVSLHGFALLLEPLPDGRLGDRFAESGNANFSSHAITSAEPAVLQLEIYFRVVEPLWSESLVHKGFKLRQML